MDRVTGRCKFKGQGEYGHIFHPNQVLVYWTQALDFTYLVSLSLSGSRCVCCISTAAGVHSGCVQCG